MLSDGYWYHNKKLFDVTADRHIELILRDPEVFGLTKDDVKAIFEKYGENPKKTKEGKAREELIKEVVKNGWIRIRHYLRPDYWSIQCDSVRRQRKVLRELVEFLIFDKEVMNLQDEVQFIGFSDNSLVRYTFMEGGINAFLQENIKKYRVSLVEDLEGGRV